MKKKTQFFTTFFLVLVLLLAGCTNQTVSNPEESSSQPPLVSDITKENNEDQSALDNSEEDKTEENTTEENSSVEEEQIKYLVNSNYFIKPIEENQSTKVVLLTFDDAPQGEQTRSILKTLEKHQAKAIFFINGHYAVKNKDLLKEIYDKGHIIGNHTWWHENLKKIDLEKTKKEIIEVNDLVEEVTGERPVYFRPPFGVMSPDAERIVLEEKMQRMNWTLGSLDWEYFRPEQKDKVVAQVIDNITSGANILMHDKEVTALALDEMLTKLTELGYSFVLPTEVILAEEQ